MSKRGNDLLSIVPEVTSNIVDERLAKWLSEHSTHKCTEKKATEKTLIYRKEQAEGVNFFPRRHILKRNLG